MENIYKRSAKPVSQPYNIQSKGRLELIMYLYVVQVFQIFMSLG